MKMKIFDVVFTTVWALFMAFMLFSIAVGTANMVCQIFGCTVG